MGQATRRLIVAGAVTIAVATLFAYIPAIEGGFVWDDDKWVTENQLLSDPDGLWRIWFSTDQPSQYFPMVYTTFRAEYALWELDPVGYHLTNVCLHAVNALLLWWLLARLGLPGAWLAAAVFALHPVHVESVAWITERKNVLTLLFSLLSLVTWTGFVRARRWTLYAASLLFYVLALLSKTTACTLPAALVLILWLERIPLDRKRWLQIAPYVSLGLAMGALTIWWERFHQGTDANVLEMSWLDRVLVAGHAIWFYLGRLFWPVELTFSYPRWEIGPGQLGWLALCVLVAGSMWIWRERIGRGPIAAIVFFVATLLPMLGFFRLFTFVYTFVADHYQYVASIGPIALTAGLLSVGTRRLGRAGPPLLIGISMIMLFTLGTLTWQQAGVYRSAETLWRDTLRKNPTSWLAHNNLATDLRARGELDQAMVHYEAALALRRDLPGSGANLHYNLANLLTDKREFDQAAAHYRSALEIDPLFVEARANLGHVLLLQGALDEAIAEYEQVVADSPRHAGGQINVVRALAHWRLGGLLRNDRPSEAIEHYRRSVSLDPDHRRGRVDLARLLADLGRLDEALSEFEQAIRQHADNADALAGAAWILATHGDSTVRDVGRAVELATTASRLTGQRDPTVLYTLMTAHAAAGEQELALAAAETALKLAEQDGPAALADELRRQVEARRRALLSDGP